MNSAFPTAPRRVLSLAVAVASAGSVAPAAAQGAPATVNQSITRAGDQASVAGPAILHRRVRVDPVWPADGQINASGPG